MTSTPLTRRRFFAATSAAALTAGTVTKAATAIDATAPEGEEMVYEVTRTEAEWLEHLDEFSYFIMRKGLTEEPKSSPLWMEFRDGTYHCKGCDLTSYDGKWKIILDKGWVFFDHAQTNAVLTGIDGPVPEYGQMADSGKTVTEVHCRRCGSHLGHLLIINKVMTHCINGAALNFKPLEA